MFSDIISFMCKGETKVYSIGEYVKVKNHNIEGKIVNIVKDNLDTNKKYLLFGMFSMSKSILPQLNQHIRHKTFAEELL